MSYSASISPTISSTPLPVTQCQFLADGAPCVTENTCLVNGTCNGGTCVSQTLPDGTDWSLSYQSKVGPVAWIEPYLENEIARLGQSSKPIVIVPLSFVADCLETLYDLDIVAAEQIKKLGIKKYVRVRVFNDDPEFAQIISDLVMEKMNVVQF
jgi:hypothetical protein